MGAESWTRGTLADRVMEAFDFDLERLWVHLQQNRGLPKALRTDWDPIGGQNGALPHLRRHSSTAITAKERPVRKTCKACGVAKVVLGCLLAIEGPELPHALSFARELVREIGGLGEIRKRITVAGQLYAEAQASEFRHLVERQQQALVAHVGKQRHPSRRRWRAQEEHLKQNLAKLAELQAKPGAAGVWDLRRLGAVDFCMRDTVREIRLGIDDVLVDLRGVLDVSVWAPLQGSKMKVVTLVEKTLREEGFSWKEIADLIEEDDSSGAIDRVRARVEGRSGRAAKKARRAK